MSMTLEQLRARDVSVQWQEAVAIVLAASEWAIDTRAGEPRFPELAAICVDPSGHVSVTAEGTGGTSPVQAAARTLGMLVPESEMPVPLRLITITALSGSSTYQHLSDYYAALRYYERPNRKDLLAALYARWLASPPRTGDAPEPPAVPVVRHTPRQRDHRAEMRRVLRSRAAKLAFAGAGLAVVVALGFWLLSHLPAGSSAGDTNPRDTRTSLLDTVAAGVEAIGRRIGLVQEPPPPPPPSVPEEPPAPPPAPPKTAPVLASRPVTRPADLVTRWTTHIAPAPIVSPEWLDTDGDADETLVVFTAADTDVAAPTLHRPRLPSQPPPGLTWEDLPLMEVVVDAQGEVVTARLLTPPRRVQDSMLLSAAKAWVFEPAHRNGRPVSYRLRLRITLP